MKAEQWLVSITIRPNYGPAAIVRKEIEESLAWLTDDHNAIRLSWGEPSMRGEWPDPDEEDDDGPH